MYLRHSTVRKDGKTHTYWRLVRSVRRRGKVVQETVAQLGELDAEGRAGPGAGARRSRGARAVRAVRGEPSGSRAIAVRLDQVRLERARRFGDVWLAGRCGGRCELDERLRASCCPRVGRQVPWSTMAAILVMARLCEPSSELHIAEDWYRRTALEDLLGVPADRVNDDRLYRALDRLLPHKERWSST